MHHLSGVVRARRARRSRLHVPFGLWQRVRSGTLMTPHATDQPLVLAPPAWHANAVGIAADPHRPRDCPPAAGPPTHAPTTSRRCLARAHGPKRLTRTSGLAGSATPAMLDSWTRTRDATSPHARGACSRCAACAKVSSRARFTCCWPTRDPLSKRCITLENLYHSPAI